MNNIQSNHPIDFNSIDKQNYTIELLRLCSICNLISVSKFQIIRQCIDMAFKKYAEQYTRRESSTISKKKAELIYSSVLYLSDVYLLSLNSIDLAIKELNDISFNDIIDKGQKLILNIHQENIRIFRLAFKNRLSIPLFEYQYVMNKSFDEYAKSYSARFDARNCCASIDYPLLGRPAYNMTSQGVVFIHEYYTGIMYENLFCKLFKEKDIKELLNNYGSIYSCKYTQLLFNISEVVLNNLLFANLINKTPLDFNVCKDDLLAFNEMYALATIEKIENDSINNFKIYKDIFQNNKLYLYLEKYIPSFAKELHLHLSNNTLDSFIVLNDAI